MRKHILVTISVCAMASLTLLGTGGTWADDQPTTGGKPAFATSADVKLATIRSLVDAKNYGQAEKLAEDLTKEHPEVVDGWMMLGYTLTLSGKFRASNTAYDQALAHGAQSTEVNKLKAYNCRRLGDPAQTRACYDQILKADPDNVEIWMQYGSFEMSSKSYDEAIRCFDHVLRVKPGDVDAVEGMAKAEEARGNPAQVKYWIEQGLAKHPDNVHLLKRISLIYLNEQNYDLAVHYLDKLLAVDPNDPAAYRNKGIAYYQQGEKAKAAAAFENVEKNGGKLDGLYGPLADCYRSMGKHDQALAIIQKGLQNGDQQAWLYSVWGKLLEDGHDYNAAIAKFNKAVNLNEEPWSGYAKKQIARQEQLMKRARMIASQGGDT